MSQRTLSEQVEDLLQENERLKDELAALKARSSSHYSVIQAYNSGAEAMRERLIELLKALRAPGETDSESSTFGARTDGGIEWVRIPYEIPFEMAKTPVTQAQWRAVMRTSPSNFKGDDLPVESVSWHEAVKFCEKIGARLPTEEEWQFAALGGGTDPYGPILDIAWVAENSNNRTHPVGRKLPNGYGLYDLLGNVWEWTDTQIGSTRVYRGGSWYDYAAYVRASYRYYNTPDYRYNYLGFRPVRAVRDASFAKTGETSDE